MLDQEAGTDRAVAAVKRLERCPQHGDALVVEPLRRALQAARVVERRAREAAGVLELPRHSRRVEESLAVRRVARHALGRSPRKHQIAALDATLGIALVQQRDRVAVVRRRLLVGEQRHRLLAGPCSVGDRLVEILARAGLPEVISELGDVRLQLVRVGQLDRGSRAAVQQPPARGREHPVAHVANHGSGR